MSDLPGARAIEQAIRQASDVNRPALAAFLTAGFPDKSSFDDLLASVAREADVVEVGVPFSDPMADGVTIQNSSRRALENGVTLSWILETVGHTPCEAPVVLMSYLNPLLAMGLESFVERAHEAKVAGLIVPDLPFEECEPMRTVLTDAGLALIQLVTPVSSDERLRRLCGASRGFVYAVTITGTTGGDTGHDQSILAYLDRVRGASTIPVLAGFGIRHAEQVRRVADHVDGVIVGSALIETLERGDDPVSYLRGLRDSTVNAVRR